MVTRRQLMIGAGAGLLGSAMRVQAAEGWAGALERDFARIETAAKARLGIAVLDTETGGSAFHRGDERFPMCSTFKVVAAGAVLARVDRGEEQLARRIRFAAKDVVPYSPATKEHAGGDGMTLAALCEAALTLSDNTAGNMMLSALGGPAGVTAYARILGDAVTRLDRTETSLNDAVPGDPRDTTSPRAMAANLQRLLLGDALSPASREQLTAWMLACRTGDARIRAGAPAASRVADKTGSGDYGTANDVAVIWPPGRKPLIVAVYLTESEAGLDPRSATIAEVARAVTAALG